MRSGDPCDLNDPRNQAILDCAGQFGRYWTRSALLNGTF